MSRYLYLNSHNPAASCCSSLAPSVTRLSNDRNRTPWFAATKHSLRFAIVYGSNFDNLIDVQPQKNGNVIYIYIQIYTELHMWPFEDPYPPRGTLRLKSYTLAVAVTCCNIKNLRNEKVWGPKYGSKIVQEASKTAHSVSIFRMQEPRHLLFSFHFVWPLRKNNKNIYTSLKTQLTMWVQYSVYHLKPNCDHPVFLPQGRFVDHVGWVNSLVKHGKTW